MKQRAILLLLLSWMISGCQIGYIIESGYHQAQLLNRRVPLEKALQRQSLRPEEREKLKLAIEVRNFMDTELGLKVYGLYSSYVALDQDSVSYAVNASEKHQLKSYVWHFPLVGSVPYKAYFKKEKALAAAEDLKKKNYDVYVRGVSAYSTLGWFDDPILSSMLKMKDHSFINLLIHETVHTHLYIKNQSKFNERVASYLGMLGTEKYYEKIQRGDELGKTLAKEKHDELLFSSFISKEIRELKAWYHENRDNPELLIQREKKFEDIKERFKTHLQPQLESQQYQWFGQAKINNAFLQLLNLYSSDFSDFETLAQHHRRDFKKVFSELKSLEKVKNPEEELRSRVRHLAPTKQ